MSYPDTIHAGQLRPGDRVYTGTGRLRRILATSWKPGYSFICLCVEGENVARSEPIGRAVYVVREAA